MGWRPSLGLTIVICIGDVTGVTGKWIATTRQAPVLHDTGLFFDVTVGLIHLARLGRPRLGRMYAGRGYKQQSRRRFRANGFASSPIRAHVIPHAHTSGFGRLNGGPTHPRVRRGKHVSLSRLYYGDET
jgi:hypothetical protein